MHPVPFLPVPTVPLPPAGPQGRLPSGTLATADRIHSRVGMRATACETSLCVPSTGAAHGFPKMGFPHSAAAYSPASYRPRYPVSEELPACPGTTPTHAGTLLPAHPHPADLCVPCTKPPFGTILHRPYTPMPIVLFRLGLPRSAPLRSVSRLPSDPLLCGISPYPPVPAQILSFFPAALPDTLHPVL